MCGSVVANLEAQKLQPVDLAIRFVGVSCWILPADAFCLCFASAGWTAPLVLLTGVLQVCAGGWLESARCPCAYVMNICMRSPACALFSQPRSCGEWTPSRPCQSASQVRLIHSTPARVQVKTMGRSRLPWSVVGFRFTLLAGRASGIRGSSRPEACLRIAFEPKVVRALCAVLWFGICFLALARDREKAR